MSDPSPSNGAPERRAARRAELLAAADAVVRRRGSSASMDAIAAEAGISKPILYRHFGDKGGLCRALIDRYAEDLLGDLRAALAAERDPRARLEATIDAYMSFIERNEDAYRFLMQRVMTERPEAQAAIADFVLRIADEVAADMRGELGRFGIDPDAAGPWAHGIVGMVQVAGDWWMRSRTLSRRQVVDHLVSLLWAGFEGNALIPIEERAEKEDVS